MIQIFVDSGANLSPELREQYNIHLLPMALTIDDQPAPEGLDGHEYYEALRSGADVRTSMVNPDDARKAFEPYIAQGDDVVYFSISAGISGSWWSAKLAGDELMEQYPQRRVCPIDSMGASLGAGIPALKASSLVRQGMGLDELVEKMTVYCQNYCQYFAVDDLKYLRKGGRISGASALVGSLLQITIWVRMSLTSLLSVTIGSMWMVAEQFSLSWSSCSILSISSWLISRSPCSGTSACRERISLPGP